MIQPAKNGLLSDSSDRNIGLPTPDYSNSRLALPHPNPSPSGEGPENPVKKDQLFDLAKYA